MNSVNISKSIFCDNPTNRKKHDFVLLAQKTPLYKQKSQSHITYTRLRLIKKGYSPCFVLCFSDIPKQKTGTNESFYRNPKFNKNISTRQASTHQKYKHFNIQYYFTEQE